MVVDVSQERSTSSTSSSFSLLARTEQLFLYYQSNLAKCLKNQGVFSQSKSLAFSPFLRYKIVVLLVSVSFPLLLILTADVQKTCKVYKNHCSILFTMH